MGEKKDTLRIEKIDGPIASKGRNGAKFYAVTFDDGLKLYDWKHFCTEFEVGDLVDIAYSDGEYPRLLGMAASDKAEEPRQRTMHEVRTMVKAGFSMPASRDDSMFYEVLTLAVQLVKDEQVQIDDKIKRAKTAFFAFKDLLRIERLKEEPGVKEAVEQQNEAKEQAALAA